jgi:hypothetical protein
MNMIVKKRADMLIPVFGTPAALSVWIVHFANVAIDVLAGPHHYVAAVFLSDVRDSWTQRNGRGVVFHSDVPEQAIANLFLNARTPLLIAYEDPLDTVGFAMAARNIDFRQAIRFVSQSYCTLARLFQAPNATIVGPRQFGMTLRDFTSLFLDTFRITATEVEKRAIVGRMLGNPEWQRDETIRQNIARHVPLARLPGAFASTLSKEERSLAEDVLHQYSIVTTGKPIRTLNWPPNILPDWDRLSSGLTGLREFTDLVGARRIITAGHVLHLPRGKWCVSVRLTVKGNYSGNDIACDILHGDISLAGIDARLPADGSFGYEIEFEIADAFPPMQFRLVLLEGAIEGELRIDSVRFENRDEPPEAERKEAVAQG